MNPKGDCPKCGIVDTKPSGEGRPTEWDCPTCRSRFTRVECRRCSRMVKETWFGWCGTGGCTYTPPAPPSPEKINEVLANLERILAS